MLADLLRRSGKITSPFKNLKTTLNDQNAYGTSAGDHFGFAVAMSDQFVLIGAYNEDDSGGNSSGKAYLYNLNTGALLFTFNNPNDYWTSANDYFGYAVAVNNQYAIIGAWQEDDLLVTSSGRVYVFDVNTGALLWTLVNPNAFSTANNDFFGFAVGVSGDFIISSAYGEKSSSSKANSGRVYVFSAITGDLLYTINNPNAYGVADGDSFGYALSVSSNYILAGAYNEDDASGNSSGKAYIFDLSTGTLLRTLNNPNAYGTSTNDYFGYAVAVTDQYAVIGAYRENNAGGTASGKVYVFNTVSGTLLYILDDPNSYGTSANDNFGYDVAISGNYIAVSAPYEDTSAATSAGKVYVFNANTGTLIRSIDDPNAYGAAANDNFGISLAMSGISLVVGTPNEGDAGGTLSGKAYIFR